MNPVQDTAAKLDPPAAAPAAATASAPAAAARASGEQHKNLPEASDDDWPAAPSLQPFNLRDVLQRQHPSFDISSNSSSSSSSGVYVLHLNELQPRRGRSSVSLRQQRGESLPFSLAGSIEEQQQPQREVSAAAAPAATTGRAAATPSAAAAAAAAAAAEAPGCLYRLEDLYLCEPCGVLLSPLQLREEVDCHLCPGCLDVLPPAEAAACGLRCSKCFTCPRCLHTLSLSRRRREEAPSTAGGGGGGPPKGGAPPEPEGRPPRAGPLWGPEGIYRFVGEDHDEDDPERAAERFTEAVSAAEEAEAAAAANGYAPLLGQQAAAAAAAAAADAAKKGEEAIIGACGADADEVVRHLEETGGFAAEGAPQRCDSLLSVQSLDGETEEDGEGAAASAAPAAAYCSRKHLYFYSCAFCQWTSEAGGLMSPVPGALPLLAAEAERDSLDSLVFSQLLSVLQQKAYEKERRRQLQQKVKNRAVAALIAAASGSLSRSSLPGGGGAAAAGGGGGGGAGGVGGAAGAPWRLSDTEASAEAKEYGIRRLDVWSYRRPNQWTFVPPRVSLTALAEGQHLTCSTKETLAAAAAAADAAEAAAAGAADDDDSATVASGASSYAAAARRYPAYTQPLHAEQLRVDRGHPDVSLILTTAHVVAAARELQIGDRPGLQQLLQCPDAYAAAASGSRLLSIRRKALLPRRSKRCCFCGRFVVKHELSIDAYPPFKIDHSASLTLPQIECCCVGGGPGGCLRAGRRGLVYLTVSSYADTPIKLTLLSATNTPRKNQHQQQHQQQQQQQEDQEEGDEEAAWWTVRWGGSPPLSVSLAPYDELLDDIGGPSGQDLGGLEDEKQRVEMGSCVVSQWGSGALLKLEVDVHPNAHESPAVLPLAAELTWDRGNSNKGGSSSLRLHYVALLGIVGRPRKGGAPDDDESEVKRTETI